MDRENVDLATCFRILRAAWFHHAIYREAQERVWETEEQEDRRREENDRLRLEYDEQTEAIIRGENYRVSPHSQYEMQCTKQHFTV